MIEVFDEERDARGRGARTRERIIAEARRYVGTPWHHQGRSTAGIDCVGFIAEVALAAGAVSDAEFEKSYRRQDNGRRMLELLNHYMDGVEIDAVQPGDVLALSDSQLKYADVPTHLMFLTQLAPYWKGIHASEHGVVEHRLDAVWKRRIHSAWRVRPREEQGAE